MPVPPIAVVDDDPAIIDMVTLLLELAGYYTISASSSAAVPALLGK